MNFIVLLYLCDQIMLKIRHITRHFYAEDVAWGPEVYINLCWGLSINFRAVYRRFGIVSCNFLQKTFGSHKFSLVLRCLFWLFPFLLDRSLHNNSSHRNWQMKLTTTTASAVLLKRAQRSLRKECLVWTKLGLEQTF